MQTFAFIFLGIALVAVAAFTLILRRRVDAQTRALDRLTKSHQALSGRLDQFDRAFNAADPMGTRQTIQMPAPTPIPVVAPVTKSDSDRPTMPAPAMSHTRIIVDDDSAIVEQSGDRQAGLYSFAGIERDSDAETKVASTIWTAR